MEDSTIEDALTTLAGLLSRKDYAAAESFWLSQSGTITDSSYWYNLGVVYRLQGKFPHARFALEKANHLSVYSAPTYKELSVVEEKLGVSANSSDANVGELLVDLGPYKLFAVGLFIGLLFLVFLNRKLALFFRVLLVLLGLLPPLLVALYLEFTTAFVTIRPLEFFTGAAQLYATGKVIPPGTRLVGYVKGEWVAVYGPAGETFWLKAQDVKRQSMFLWD